MLQKLSPYGSGKVTECEQIRICLSISNNLKTMSRLGHFRITQNILKCKQNDQTYSKEGMKSSI